MVIYVIYVSYTYYLYYKLINFAKIEGMENLLQMGNAGEDFIASGKVNC